MRAYLDIIKKVLDQGSKKMSRPGIECSTIAGMIFEHEMSQGYPLLTTKKMPFRLIATELEFFIKGLTDKQWLIDCDNHIWDEWARRRLGARRYGQRNLLLISSGLISPVTERISELKSLMKTKSLGVKGLFSSSAWLIV